MSALLLMGLECISLVVCWIELATKKTSVLLYWILTVFFALICAIRGTVTQDTIPYIEAFHMVVPNVWYGSRAQTPLGFELGYTVLMQVCKFVFGDDYHMFFFIVVIIDYMLLYATYRRFSKKLPHAPFLLTLFCIYTSFFGTYYSGIVLRGGLAISLLLYASALLMDKRYLRALVLLFLAIEMQSSAEIGVLIAIILGIKTKISKVTYRMFLVILMALDISRVNDVLFPKILTPLTNYVMKYNIFMVFRPYLVNSVLKDGSSIRLIYYICLGLLISTLDFDEYPLLRRLFNVYCFGVFIGVLLNGLQTFSRVTDFFTIFSIILMTFYVAKKTVSRKAVLYSTALVSVMTFINFILLTRIANLVY